MASRRHDSPGGTHYQPLPHAPSSGDRDERTRINAVARRQSPLDLRRNGLPAAIGPSHQQVARQRDKFVPLSNAASDPAAAASVDGAGGVASPTQQRPQQQQQQQYAPYPPASLFGDLQEPSSPAVRGRITVMAVSESFDRAKLDALLAERFSKSAIHSYQEAVHLSLPPDDASAGDVCFFNFGTVVFWGITAADEQALLHTVVNPCKLGALEASEVDIDEFTFIYSSFEPPHIQNDAITINRSYAADHQVKLAISHGLAQSTKLGIYEERITVIVEATKHLPESLARTGSVTISRKQIARLIGHVFLQRSAVNLLSTVMDTPEFFWSAPDHLQVLYKRAIEYLELDTRVEVLNARFVVLQEMLNVLRDHLNNKHMARLEWIVIWLIVVEVIVGLLELAGLINWSH